MSIVIAGDRSGTGKTTLTLALLAALRARKQTVQSFKVGPDYIDPMFHRAVTGRDCYNLDPVLTSEAYVQTCFAQQMQAAEYGVIEGVMGLFDGASGEDDIASTAHIARLLDLPVVLVVDCGRMARSLAALVAGYRDFDPNVKLRGVVLNRVGSDRHLQLLQNAIAAIDVPILGVFHREADIELPSRHLGLVPAGEVDRFGQTVERLAVVGERGFDWGRLVPVLREGEQGRGGAGERGSRGGSHRGLAVLNPDKGKERTRIAIARDQAFNFYYPDNLTALEVQGAELIEWSPLGDDCLPEADGFYFGGGFPEVFAQQLSENLAVRSQLKKASAQGCPTYAECGGLMYLGRTLIDFDQREWDMVGSLPYSTQMGQRLRLGYRKASAIASTPILEAGQAVVGHEFHKSSLTELLERPIYRMQRYWGETQSAVEEGHCQKNVHASYLHLHWGDRPDIPYRFVQKCRHFAQHRLLRL